MRLKTLGADSKVINVGLTLIMEIPEDIIHLLLYIGN